MFPLQSFHRTNKDRTPYLSPSHAAHQSSLEIFSAIRPRDESSRSGMCVWHIPHRNHYDLLRLLVVPFGKLRRNSCEITKTTCGAATQLRGQIQLCCG